MLRVVSVIGDSETSDKGEIKFAEKLGTMLAERGYVILTGGRGGVMEAVCKGAKQAGGITVAILPSADKAEANPYVDIPIPTGLGWARNQIVVLGGDVIIAIGGRSGTLSEIAYAWMYNKPIIAVPRFGGWSMLLGGKKVDDRRKDKIFVANTVEEVIKKVEEIFSVLNNFALASF